MSAVLQERPALVEPIERPTTQTIVLPVNDELMAGIRPSGAAVEAAAWDIDSAEMAQLAADQRTAWAKRVDAIKAMRKDFVEPAQAILERAKKWFSPPIDDFEAGRKILGDKLLAWDQKEKDRVAAENAKREAEARAARQRAEAEAAAARAKAEEQAAEARRKAAEAEQARQKALAEGNAKAAAAAAAEAAKQAERASAVVENAEAKATQNILSAAAVQAPVATVTKIAGSQVKENWMAVLNQGVTEEQALAMIVKAVVTENRPDLLALLKIDTSARGPLHKLAAAQKSVMRVPGYTAKDVPSLAGSRK